MKLQISRSELWEIEGRASQASKQINHAPRYCHEVTPCTFVLDKIKISDGSGGATSSCMIEVINEAEKRGHHPTAPLH